MNERNENMPRVNIAFLYGRVLKSPILVKDKDTGVYNYSMMYLDVVRGLREVDDDVRYVRHDYPLVISRESELIETIEDFKENDIVLLKGTLSTKKIPKRSYCPNCTDEEGVATENTAYGNLVYITPIYIKKVAEFENKTDAIQHIVDNREVSNQIYVAGTLLKDPKFFTTKQGVQIAQYPVAINRKFIIRTDDPSIRTDYPVVKSYGEQARNDKAFLKYQSEIIVDGFLQARRVTRKCKCKACGNIYAWKDNSMELVPYEVEYLLNYLTPEDVEEERKMKVEQYKQMLFTNGLKDDIDEEEQSDDLI